MEYMAIGLEAARLKRTASGGRGTELQDISDMDDQATGPFRAARRTVSGPIEGPAQPEHLRDEVLAEIFAATAARAPGHPALVFEDRTLTYAEVARLSDRIATGLIRRGIGVGDVVGLFMPRGADLLIAQLAITKTGAAWLPFDADAPIERIAACLEDASARALVTAVPAAEEAQLPCPAVRFADLAQGEEVPVPVRPAGLTPDHPAYMIYTSGSTGTPKGIVVSHRNICHFLRAANDVYGIRSDDIVFQGASVAFDLSMEEIFVPYLVGATLVVATASTLSDTEALPAFLAKTGVTVIDTVPTLLSMVDSDLPGVRLILLGGEALPSPLLERFAGPGRRLFNTYGPTEATVVATLAELGSGDRVTIGRPLPNYSCIIVDEALNPVPAGTEGELLIGGPGVAKGYLNRPELTATKFVANPFANAARAPVLYRTGDACSIDAAGNIVFHGRIDDQVKIRGFRVELGEIEERLAKEPGIAQAAAVLRSDEGIDRLVAFVVPAAREAPDGAALTALRAALRRQLPPYMVPSHIETVAALPRLSSGKIDRKALKGLALSEHAPAEAQEEPQNETESVLLAAARQVFGHEAIPLEADFLTELGGHSLLAARFISLVRQTPRLASITLQDVYAQRTIRAMARELVARGAASQAAVVELHLPFAPPPLRRRFLCGLAQAAAMPFILALVTLQWLGLFIASIFVIQDDVSLVTEMSVLLGIYVLINLGTKALTIGLKWLIIGRTKPGCYPLWGSYYFRIWLVSRLLQVTTVKFLQGSPLMRVYLRLLGARVGRDAMISEFEAGAVDLLTIGDRASTGLKTKFANVAVIGNKMVVSRIDIGPDAYVGNSCVLGPDTTLEAGAEIADLTAIPEGTTVGAQERWDGSPARMVGRAETADLPAFPTIGRAHRAAQFTAYAVGYNLMLMLGLMPIFPAFYVLYNLDTLFTGAADYDVSWSALPFLAVPTAAILIVASMLIIVATRWLILPRVRAGSYSIHSWFYLRKWLVGLALEVTLETLNSLYATIYMRGWYRLMGARIGAGTEISSNLAGRYDLVELGENNFVGDESILGDEEVRGGFMTLKHLKTGDRVFIGNDAVISQGAVLEDDALIGVKSKLPETLHVAREETWFGSPALKIPNRQRVNVGAAATYKPTRAFMIGRAIFEALHMSLPTALFITCGYITADIIAEPLEAGQWAAAGAILLASGVVIATLLILLAAAVKWIMIGVYRPVMKPMWSWWAMRTEAVAVLYGGLVGKASLEFLRGTPFLPWVLRLFGTRMGRGVWMDCTDITEFDCVTVGDYAVLNTLAVLQTHLYEDRVMKVGRIEIGRGVTIGAGTTILYDTKVHDHVRLRPLTIVMKGEELPANTEWEGAPAVPANWRPGKENERLDKAA
jgi:non-ribosomal peptide synthetase-like protein